MLTFLGPDRMDSAGIMRERERALIQLIKERGERDNITVVTIKTYH